VTENPLVQAAPERSGTAGSWIKQFVIRRAVGLSVLLAIVTVLSWGARWHWALDLLSHFPVQTSAAAIVLLVILLGLRQWKAAILPALVGAVSVAQLVPLHLPVRQPSYSGEVIHAVSANVLRSNQEYGKFIEYIRASRPDLFLVLEVDEIWLTELAPLHKDYPYFISHPGRGAFGIGLFSRVPIEDYEIIESAVAGVPMIRATLVFGDRPLSFFGAHPLPPVRSDTAALRNGQLEEIAALTAPLANPRLLLGDLNVTSWSPHFTDLLKRTGLRDGRRGFGIQPTWPGLPGAAGLTQIPIDHTLVSDDVEVVVRRVGPDVGSDHLPVEIEFRIGN
jgi:endonuclease/exonuclease/phosphatase (EEP) superfamily protein YafD